MGQNSVTNTNDSVIAIIQARMNSSRLPGKTLKELNGKPILAHIIDRARRIKGVSAIVVATGNPEDNIPILDLTEKMGALPFTGDDNNVLKRMYDASQRYKSDFIIRITGDNPFTDVDYGSLAVEHAIETQADLSSVSGIPLGTAVELIKSSALEQAYRKADKPHQLEHVTPYIKEHPEEFSILRKHVDIYNMTDNLRLTVDTDDDFTLAQEIFQRFQNRSDFSLHEILNYIRLRPELLNINCSVVQRPMTHYAKPSHSYNSHSL